MDTFDFDFFVIGAGSGGVRAARVASRLGARVAIAENHRLGGTCVIRGCVPKKLMVLAAHFGEDFEDAIGFGWEPVRPGFSWQRLVEARDREVARLSAIYERLLTDAGVEIVTGAASIPSPGTVAVGDRQFRCRHILIATGGWPFVPDIPGAEHAVTSNEVFELKTPPRRVLVVGGGYIAVEFAGIFHGLGAEVCLSYRGDQILRSFDGDVRAHLSEEMRRKGIDIALGSTVRAIRRRDDGLLDVDGEQLAAARDIGQNVFGETCPQYLYLSLEEQLGAVSDEYGAFEGAKWVCSTPLRSKAEGHQDHMWQSLRTNDIQMVSTDHCPFCMKDQKELGLGDFSKIPNGIGSVEHRMDLMYQGVVTGQITLERWVEITSTTPARMFGLYGKKGVIAPGADADIVVYDPNAHTSIGMPVDADGKPTGRKHHMNMDHAAWEGFEIDGKVDTVISRGSVVIQNDEFHGRAGHGQYVRRGLSQYLV